MQFQVNLLWAIICVAAMLNTKMLFYLLGILLFVIKQMVAMVVIHWKFLILLKPKALQLAAPLTPKMAACPTESLHAICLELVANTQYSELKWSTCGHGNSLVQNLVKIKTLNELNFNQSQSTPLTYPQLIVNKELMQWRKQCWKTKLLWLSLLSYRVNFKAIQKEYLLASKRIWQMMVMRLESLDGELSREWIIG